MVLGELPATISPSRVATFTDCPRMFQYQAIDRLEQPPTEATLKGTLVHAALEGLFSLPAADRSVDAALAALHAAADAATGTDGFASLGADATARQALLADAEVLVRHYFDLEDPTAIDAVGIELRLETMLEGSGGLAAVHLRGIIDRLDRDEHGNLVVVDYKTGRSPAPGREREKMAGVETYALLCERALGVRPVAVRLLYLRGPVAVEREVLSSTVQRQERRTVEVWRAITKAHASGSFRPSPGPLCGYCAFADRCEGAASRRVAGSRRVAAAS
jgi:putative RecB family exonuclease